MSNYAHSEHSSSQETLHSLYPLQPPTSTLSSNKRAYQAFQEASEAREISHIARILSDDFEYHDLTTIPPFHFESAHECANRIGCTKHSLVQNKGQYIQDKINALDNVAFARIDFIMQRFIQLIHNIGYARVQTQVSSRVFQLRQLSTYEFETPSVDSFPTPEIGVIRRIKVMSDSAQWLRDSIVVKADTITKDDPSMAEIRNLKGMNSRCGSIAADSLGFNEYHLGCFPPRTPVESPQESRTEKDFTFAIVFDHTSAAKRRNQEKSGRSKGEFLRSHIIRSSRFFPSTSGLRDDALYIAFLDHIGNSLVRFFKDITWIVLCVWTRDALVRIFSRFCGWTSTTKSNLVFPESDFMPSSFKLYVDHEKNGLLVLLSIGSSAAERKKVVSGSWALLERKEIELGSR
ncbi:hypothetical protein BDP27DRAFT_1357383 [Rhodocollybia butyracea]|uniref:Uncharacterized protein n=1 Tax=Rhodocollybia butyracea TaxID=206335 RepID=A0A9P5UFG8_9AGAR|nr:hypothetical protein BDP27DRAFT_1357383 [Rhodocollybia butyracea]